MFPQRQSDVYNEILLSTVETQSQHWRRLSAPGKERVKSCHLSPPAEKLRGAPLAGEIGTEAVTCIFGFAEKPFFLNVNIH